MSLQSHGLRSDYLLSVKRRKMKPSAPESDLRAAEPRQRIGRAQFQCDAECFFGPIKFVEL
ncbi:MAG: hypothetical protein M9921_13245 [Fimbriimonadaceae bacterium]|nr:hypothetical protein [Fimbriimonadaceae bacterium]